MNKRILLIGLAILPVTLLVVGAAGAQTSTSYDLSWYVLAGGGRQSNSTSYVANSTLGQSVAAYSDSASYGMQSGYWQRWQDRYLYLPLVMKTFSP